MITKKKVLLLTDWYEPAFKAGGPVRSCVNMVKALGNDYEFYIFAGAYDLGEAKPLQGITLDYWYSVHGHRIYYSTNPGYNQIASIIRDIAPDVVYLNSMFSYKFAILPLLYLKINNFKGRVILCPRGMLKHSALAFKNKKKILFLGLGKAVRLFKNVIFHATDNQEVLNIKEIFPDSEIIKAANFPSSPIEETLSIKKIPGSINLLVVGRIHPIKGIDLLLKALFHVKGQVNLTIVGKLEDADYWKQCERSISLLSKNVRVFYAGEHEYKDIAAYYLTHHVLISPTLGENYGHAIVDAFLKRRPVIISDQTPWRNLAEQKAGFDIKNDIYFFAEKIQTVIDWDQREYDEYVEGAGALGIAISSNENLIYQYKILFA